jgi:hypothetical protein
MTALGSHLVKFTRDLRNRDISQHPPEHLEQGPLFFARRLRGMVVDPQTIPTVLQQPGVEQVTKVPGRLGLRNLEKPLNLADAKFPVAEDESEDLKANVFGERLELLRQLEHDYTRVCGYT